MISIHILHVEDDAGKLADLIGGSKISIHILHVEDDREMALQGADSLISIHILHVEDDKECGKEIIGGKDFNPHPPCGG